MWVTVGDRLRFYCRELNLKQKSNQQRQCVRMWYEVERIILENPGRCGIIHQSTLMYMSTGTWADAVKFPASLSTFLIGQRLKSYGILFVVRSLMGKSAFWLNAHYVFFKSARACKGWCLAFCCLFVGYCLRLGVFCEMRFRCELQSAFVTESNFRDFCSVISFESIVLWRVDVPFLYYYK